VISSVVSDITTGSGAFLDALHKNITYAYQPIVNVHTGEAYGFEALLRGHRALGFSEIPMLFASMADIDMAVLESANVRRHSFILTSTISSRSTIASDSAKATTRSRCSPI
jgi:predicted signal transduction protein with EAL and GGDEF domain